MGCIQGNRGRGLGEQKTSNWHTQSVVVNSLSRLLLMLAVKF